MFQPPPPDPGKLLLAGTLDRVRMTASASGPHSLDEPRTLVSTSCEMNLQHEGGGGGPICSWCVLSHLPNQERGLKPIQPQNSQTKTLSQLFLSRDTDCCLFPSSSTSLNNYSYQCYNDES